MERLHLKRKEKRIKSFNNLQFSEQLMLYYNFAYRKLAPPANEVKKQTKLIT